MNLKPGLYLVTRHKLGGAVNHYGILMKRRDGQVRVFQFNPDGCRMLSPEEFAAGNQIVVRSRVPDDEVRGAFRRAEQFVKEGSKYNAATNNCEHAARWIAEGRRQSPQVTRVGLLSLALIFWGVGS